MVWLLRWLGLAIPPLLVPASRGFGPLETSIGREWLAAVALRGVSGPARVTVDVLTG